MEEILVFSDNKTGEKVGMYYNAWLFIIRCILVKYVHKTTEEADEILKNIIIRDQKIMMTLYA